jgi:DNA-binding SARP family transcriptional activator
MPPPPVARMRPPRLQAIDRERLLEQLVRDDGERLILINAPAGSGKTTLLAQAAATHRPTVWYLLDVSDAEPSVLVLHLEHATSLAMPGLPTGWKTMDDVARSLEAWPGPPALVILDELELLAGSPSELAIEHLVEIGPPNVTFVMASRSTPEFNLSRLRVSGLLNEIDEDDLRFRPWEVEQLFRSLYRERMAPEDILLLTRRVNGWAAGLRLFHLAARGKTQEQRRQILASLATRPTLVEEYLARTVVDELPEALSAFLKHISILEEPTVDLCNQLLGIRGSRMMLRDLQRRQLVTRVDLSEAFRCHTTLRTYLEDTLVDELGETAASARYRRAGALLERCGSPGAALRAYCRAADWDSVRRLLDQKGRRIADESKPLDEIPERILNQDPWLRIALARRLAAAGRFGEALAPYLEAERDASVIAATKTARRERRTLAAWLAPDAALVRHWSAPLRVATMHDPDAAAVGQPPVGSEGQRRLVTALAALFAGEVNRALGHLRAGAAEMEADALSPLSIGARVTEGAALLLGGDPSGVPTSERAADDADRRDIPWLARLARAVIAVEGRPGSIAEAASAAIAFERCGDPWGSGLSGLFEGWGRVRSGLPATEPLSRSIRRFEEVGATVPAAWARATLALAFACGDEEDPRPLATKALYVARHERLRGVAAVAYLALAEAEGNQELRARANRSANACGLLLPATSRGAGTSLRTARASDRYPDGVVLPESSTMAIAPCVAIRCLGGFEIDVRGCAVELTPLKPTPRKALRILAIHAGRPVHREVLAEALWSDVAREVGIRNVHVAISSLRHFLRVAGVGKDVIVREEEAYRLVLPYDGSTDVATFERWIEDGRRARSADDLDRAGEAFGRALDLYRPLLPEDGPAEWVVELRDRIQGDACDAAIELVRIHLDRGVPLGAVAAAAQGLRADPYRDELWRLRIVACERAGNLAAAARARRDYGRVLQELGVVDGDLEQPSGYDDSRGAIHATSSAG